MKVLLTGSTGFIGQEVLSQCLKSSAITSIVVLSRRSLPASIVDNNNKLKVVVIKDFAVYSEDVMRELDGIEACIWCLGSASIPNVTEARRITIDFTLAAARACQKVAADSPRSMKSRPFRFVYLSGIIAERDQTKPLWYMQDFRRIRGRLETELLEFASCTNSGSSGKSFESYVVRPGMVLADDGSGLSLKNMFGYLIPSVKVDVLAMTMIDLAVGGGRQSVVENADLTR